MNFRLHGPNLAALDAYLSTLPDGTSRPEAIRLILNDWLIGHGYLPFSDDPEMAN